MNTSVSFEIAKLLKEKGFDNESAHYYNEKGEILFDVDFPSLQPTKPDVYYDNPTIAEAVMWLYEKYGIWINVFDLGKFSYTIATKERWYWEEGDNKSYNSPVEAYVKAIEYTVNNLL